ncbi:hypothetical protein FLW53_34315, partial [Microbispora sp. SCL1-1]
TSPRPPLDHNQIHALTEQVLAWLITAKGRATAITVDAIGYVDTADSADRFLAPGEDPPERAYEDGA